MAKKPSGSCPVDLKVSKSQTTHALYLLSHGFFSGSRVSGNHAAHSSLNSSLKLSSIGGVSVAHGLSFAEILLLSSSESIFMNPIIE